MGIKTNIQWCDSTVNATTGCDGCELWVSASAKSPGRKTCYAGRLHEGRLSKSLPNLYNRDFTDVGLAPGRMAKAAAWSDLTGKERPDKPWLNGLPRTIFISDMADALSAGVPAKYLLDEVIDNVLSEAGRRHRWYWLTKQPRRMADFAQWLKQIHGVDWPRNLWAGTSVTSQVTASRVDALLDVGDDMTRRFVSAEPLVGPVDFGPKLGLIDWLIVGGESGPGARPFDVRWADMFIGESRAIGTKVFIKQFGSVPFDSAFPPGSPDRLVLVPNDSHGGDWTKWPEQFRVREVVA